AALLVCGLLCLVASQTLSKCAPTDYMLYVEKYGCAYCVAINTTICSGFCYSRDTNVKGVVGKSYFLQRSCTYQVLEYRTVLLPGCPLHINPLLSYPLALRCHCSRCNTDNNDCTHKASETNECTKPIQPADSYPGQSNYIQMFWNRRP
uniref:Thyrotropin subunit beta n=1 Tax=Lepisosteus oculatus TaxID=7918 RepID=W5MXA6_LEPOC